MTRFDRLHRGKCWNHQLFQLEKITLANDLVLDVQGKFLAMTGAASNYHPFECVFLAFLVGQVCHIIANQGFHLP